MIIDDIPFILMFAVVVVVAFIMGMTFQHYRIMTRFEDATKEEAEKVTPHCGNCLDYDGDHCTLYWNNADDDYYVPERDDKDPYDCCDYWQFDENAEQE